MDAFRFHWQIFLQGEVFPVFLFFKSRCVFCIHMYACAGKQRQPLMPCIMLCDTHIRMYYILHVTHVIHKAGIIPRCKMNAFYLYVYIMLFLNHKAKKYAADIHLHVGRTGYRADCETGPVCIFVALFGFCCREIWLHAYSAFIVAFPHLGPCHAVEVVCVNPNCCVSPEPCCLL